LRSPRTRLIAAALGAVVVAALLIAAVIGYRVVRETDAGAAPAPAFVGSETCAGCHGAEASLWHGSQHAHAMAHASDKTVLGDFNNASFDYYGVRSRFFRKDGKYLVETDGPDGKLATFEVKYTFGIDPLQQYLVEFPDGRIQALSLAWDSRDAAHGGQRWFHLYPNEDIKHDDVLHWTKLNQNWNFMCAECHSTGVRKNYDAATDRFATSWAEISVGCEACHGQGSRHIAWAHDRNSWWPVRGKDDPTKGLLVRFDERDGVTWRRDPKTGNPQRNFSPALVRKEVETCGLCHARRGEFAENWTPGRPLSDTHVVSLLAHGLYEADGQMRDEVYNYGSFKQSKMFAAGVTCSDCHEPHGARLRVPGDGVCLQCHAPEKYASVQHSHHDNPGATVTCASCHMPSRTYMVVDRRHDHSFRIPRPDLSAKLGTPNACNDCHGDKTPEWAAAAIERWYGSEREGFQHYASAFHAAAEARADAARLLAAVAVDRDAPAIARASALTALAPYLSAASVDLAKAGLADPDPLVRVGALDMLQNAPPAQVWPIAAPLLADPIRGVRIKAAELLAAVPAANQPPADRERFAKAAAEFVAAQQLNADRPEARSTLGNFYTRSGRFAEAESEYKAALRLSPNYAPAAINLADLYRALHRDDDAEKVLRDAIAASPDDAGLHYALGLTLTRLKRPTEALEELRRAAALQPERSRYAYVLGVALHSQGDADAGIAVLKDNLTRHQEDRDTLSALIGFNRDAGNFTEALRYARQLALVTPDDPNLPALIDELSRQAK
jgi:predicted CXXCH cytochrome family protein